jgi:hypothetical protein
LTSLKKLEYPVLAVSEHDQSRKELNVDLKILVHLRHEKGIRSINEPR